MTTVDGKDPAGLGLEVCTEPAPPGSQREVTVSIRRGATQEVLWSDVADYLAQSHVVGEQAPPALQVVLAYHVEPDADEEEEDAYYVVDLELVDGKVNEVNRFRDSGD